MNETKNAPFKELKYAYDGTFTYIQTHTHVIIRFSQDILCLPELRNLRRA